VLLFPKERAVDGRRPGGATGGGQADRRQEARRSTSSPPAGALMGAGFRRRYQAILPALVVPDWKWLEHINPSSLMGGFIYAFQIHC